MALQRNHANLTDFEIDRPAAVTPKDHQLSAGYKSVQPKSSRIGFPALSLISRPNSPQQTTIVRSSRMTWTCMVRDLHSLDAIDRPDNDGKTSEARGSSRFESLLDGRRHP